jgi:hypothetical protein
MGTLVPGGALLVARESLIYSDGKRYSRGQTFRAPPQGQFLQQTPGEPFEVPLSIGRDSYIDVRTGQLITRQLTTMQDGTVVEVSEPLWAS